MLPVNKNLGDGVVGCGDGLFCCHGQGDNQCCSTLSNVFSLGVATYLNSVAGPSTKTLEVTIANPTTTSTTATASTSTNMPLSSSSTSILVPAQRTSSISSGSTVRSSVAASSTLPSPTPSWRTSTCSCWCGDRSGRRLNNCWRLLILPARPIKEKPQSGRTTRRDAIRRWEKRNGCRRERKER